MLTLQMRTCNKLETLDEKKEYLFRVLNTGGSKELYILEAIKVLMLVCAYELHKAYGAEQDVPVFVWLLFARDSSETVARFLTNHLNRVGRDSGVEQVRA